MVLSMTTKSVENRNLGSALNNWNKCSEFF